MYGYYWDSVLHSVESDSAKICLDWPVLRTRVLGPFDWGSPILIERRLAQQISYGGADGGAPPAGAPQGMAGG